MWYLIIPVLGTAFVIGGLIRFMIGWARPPGRTKVGSMTEDTTAKDLDETRRLLYMALVAGRTDRYDLAGTLANALLHHSDVVSSMGRAEVINRILDTIEHGDLDGWASGTIDTITADLTRPGDTP